MKNLFKVAKFKFLCLGKSWLWVENAIISFLSEPRLLVSAVLWLSFLAPNCPETVVSHSSINTSKPSALGASKSCSFQVLRPRDFKVISESMLLRLCRSYAKLHGEMYLKFCFWLKVDAKTMCVCDRTWVIDFPKLTYFCIYQAVKTRPTSLKSSTAGVCLLLQKPGTSWLTVSGSHSSLHFWSFLPWWLLSGTSTQGPRAKTCSWPSLGSSTSRF